jgi:uncharacterized protein (TIGR00296 family)
MATAAHCIACFEALDGHLSKRKPLSLEEIQSKWDAYTKAAAASSSSKSAALGSTLPPPNASATSGSSSSLSSASSSTAISSADVSTPATSTSSLPLASSRFPLFVTWNTYDVDDDDADLDDEEVSLRGCIGTFENQDLNSAVAEYALISAVQDSRFPPISKYELPLLQTAVTLLTNFESVSDPYDWEIGTHGVRLSFQDRGRRYGSTYLPDVAAEQGWTKEETLFSLCRKAGWMGTQSKFRDLPLNVTRYQGSKHSMGYREYKKWRSWVESN